MLEGELGVGGVAGGELAVGLRGRSFGLRSGGLALRLCSFLLMTVLREQGELAEVGADEVLELFVFDEETRVLAEQPLVTLGVSARSLEEARDIQVESGV